jgi:hypothetical protein
MFHTKFLKLVSQHYVLSGVSDLVYHYTSLFAAAKILKEDITVFDYTTRRPACYLFLAMGFLPIALDSAASTLRFASSIL